MKKHRSSETDTAAAPESAPVEPQQPAPRSVAYHDGPPEIFFAGRRWIRGKAQPVTEAEWRAMQARPDCAGFGFAEIRADAEAGEAQPAPQD